MTSESFSYLFVPWFSGVARRYYSGLSCDGQVASSRTEVNVLCGGAHLLPLLMSIIMLNAATSINHLYKQIVFLMCLKCPSAWRVTQMSPRYEVNFTYILVQMKGTSLYALVFMKHASTQNLWNTPALSSVWQIYCTKFFSNRNLKVEDKDGNFLATVSKVWTICKQICYSLYFFYITRRDFISTIRWKMYAIEQFLLLPKVKYFALFRFSRENFPIKFSRKSVKD